MLTAKEKVVTVVGGESVVSKSEYNENRKSEANGVKRI